MNWNKFVLVVQPRLINPSLADYGCLKASLTDSFELPVNTNCTIADVKELIEEHIRQGMTEKESVDLIELRLNERVSLPSSTKISSITHNSKYQLHAVFKFDKN